MATDPPGSRRVITILGATGSLGRATVVELADRPVRLRLVGRGPHPAYPTGQARIETVSVDLTDPSRVAEVVGDADAVLCFTKHSGGWRDADSVEAEQVNVGVVRSLVAAARDGEKVPVVVYAGSSSQSGPPARTPLDGTEPDQPASAFDRQKLAAERLLLDAGRSGLLRGVSLRLPMVYGGPADKGVVAAMARRAVTGGELTMWDDGRVRRDLLHVRDAAAAFVAALDHADALAGRHWLVGSGTGVSLADLFAAIAEAVARCTGDAPVPVVSVPAPVNATAGDLRDLVLDARPFRSATGWEARIPLAEGVPTTVAALIDTVAVS